MMKKVISYTWLVLVALFMYIPVAVLAVYSFTESTTIGAVRGFSLKNYVTLFTMSDLRDMIIGCAGYDFGNSRSDRFFLFQTIFQDSFGDGESYSCSQRRGGDSVCYLYTFDCRSGN